MQKSGREVRLHGDFPTRPAGWMKISRNHGVSINQIESIRTLFFIITKIINALSLRIDNDKG
jgi:hypothetical protein